uniref:Chitin-binding type-2 domain-containing protein n=1 Tax=Anopheles atroparvus TaxID=41427 RepID=A0AAG5DW60_ANOAO
MAKVNTITGWLGLVVSWVAMCLAMPGQVDVLSVADGNARLWPVGCVEPSCATEFARVTLWPFEDPNFFLQCAAGGGAAQWELVRQPCQGRLLFHFTRQSCTLPADWEATCPEQGGGSADPLEPCPVVRCEEAADLQRLWPAEDSDRFYQCIPQAAGGVLPVAQTCPGGTLFSLRYQACITPLRWTEECSFDGGEVTPGPTGGDTDPTTTVTAPTTTTTESGGWTLCQMPICEREDQVLYPHTDRMFYWQCVPQPNGFWAAQMRPCGAGTVFHYGLQLCVFPADWVNFCPA